MSETVRDFRPAEDDASVAALWQRCFGEAAGGQTTDWLFRSGAAGECPRTVIESEGRIIAHAGVTALLFRVGDQEVRGGYSVAAMTDPAARGRGLFLRTAEALYARLEREGFAFVAGFSNSQSHRIMTGPLGRTAVRPFPWCVRVLRPLAIGRALLLGSAESGREPSRVALDELPGLQLALSACAFDDPRLDALWQRAASDVQVGCVRDAGFAQSRYATRPEASYRPLLLERAGTPVAFVVTRELTLRGLRALFLVDFIVAPGEDQAGQQLLRAIEKSARADGVQLLSALLPGTGQTRESLKAAGFRRVPERLHPQVIRFSVRGFGHFSTCESLTDPRAWHLSWADTDVV